MDTIWKRALLTILPVMVIVSASILIPKVAAQYGASSSSAAKLSSDYQKALEIIRENSIADASDEALTKSAIHGMLKTLDPHSDYMDRKTFQEFNEKQHSQYFGIGSSISTRHRATYVIEPFRDTPAFAAGLRYGDQIIAVDSVDTSKWSSDRVRSVLVGERGTTVSVTIQRPGVAEPITRTITREA